MVATSRTATCGGSACRTSEATFDARRSSTGTACTGGRDATTRATSAAGADSSGPVELDWPYTQSDLAAMIGGTRQSVNRLLSELITDGLVRLETDRLIVTDVRALERRSDR